MAKDGLSFETPVSNSYAAPVITAKIHEILCSLEKERMSVPIVYQKLAGQKGNMFRMRPDFIEDVILFQREKGALQQEILFFSIMERVDNPESLAETIDRYPYTPVVLIPSHNWEIDKKVFRLCQERCRLGFLYAGKAPAELENMTLLFWDEGQYCESFKQFGYISDGVFPTDTARLLVEGEGYFPLLIAVNIQQEFQEHEYPCIIVSDYPYAYLYDMEYLPEGVEVERFAMDMATLRQASVVIYCLQNRARNKEPKYNFKVSVGEYAKMETSGTQIYFPEMPEHREIKGLYQYVLDYEEKV
ncbi:MAG: hypothetical protein NC392_10790 [Roseburia sp.]|nr:hypothetical protein [Roseburia sp.]